MCLGVLNSSFWDGANILLQTCRDEQNQQFALTKRGSGSYQIPVRHSRQCLDVQGAGRDNATNLIQSTCNWSQTQLFQIRESSDRYGAYEIVSSYNGLCFDIAGARTEDGANAHLWSCYGGHNQLFEIPNYSPAPRPRH